MKFVEIIWEIIKLLFGGMEYDRATYQIAEKYDMDRKVLIRGLEKRGYYRDNYRIKKDRTDEYYIYH